MKVPWISKEDIAQKATDVIQNFQSLANYEVEPPIPVAHPVKIVFTAIRIE